MIKIKIFRMISFFILLSAPFVIQAKEVPIKIENVSNAITYLGYNENIILTVPDIQENHTPYILPIKNENGYSKKILSMFEGDVLLKNIKKENNDFILEFDNKDKCLDYYYNRTSDFKKVDIKACNNYVSQIIFTYSNKSNYRLSSEDLEQRFNKIVDNIKNLGFTQKSKDYGILSSIDKYFSMSPQIARLEKDNIDIIVQINNRDNNIYITITQKDSYKKYLEIKEKINDEKTVKENKNIDDFIK